MDAHAGLPQHSPVATSSSSRRPRRPARNSDKPALDRAAVIRAALAEIDEKGVGSFNLRDLARRLGVYPTAVYWHVPTKTHLLAEVAATLFRDVAPKTDGGDWRDYLRTLFRRYRRAMKRHPNVAPLVGAHLVGNLGIDLVFVEGVLAALQRAGLSGAALTAGYNAVIASLVGFVVQEFSPMPDDGFAEWQAAIRERLAAVDPERYPVLAANLPVLANKAFIVRWQNGVRAPLDASFEAFVEQVIAGIEALESSPARFLR